MDDYTRLAASRDVGWVAAPWAVCRGVDRHLVSRGVVGDAALVQALQDHVKATIAPYKYPREIAFLDKLPRTETGKLQRFKLRQLQS